MTVEDSPEREDRLKISDLLLVFLLIAGGALFLPALLRLLGILPGADPLIDLVLLYCLQYFWMLGVTLGVARGLRGLTWQDLGFRAPVENWLPGTLGITFLALASAPLMNFLVYISYDLVTGEPFVNPQVAALAPRGNTLASYIAMLLAAGVLAPIVEETVFRGLLYNWLRRRAGFLFSALVSAFLFSIAHFILVLVPALFVVGVLLAWVYERYNSLLPVIFLHGIFNASMLTMLYIALSSSGAASAQP